MIYAVVAYAFAALIWAVYLFSLWMRAVRIKERQLGSEP